jgi:hypothetical protein
MSDRQKAMFHLEKAGRQDFDIMTLVKVDPVFTNCGATHDSWIRSTEWDSP